jgi:hypothetical protein
MKKILTSIIVMVSLFATKTAADTIDFTVTPILEGEQTMTNQTISAKYHDTASTSTLTYKITIPMIRIDIDIKTAIPDLDSNGNQIFSDCNTFLKAPQTITLPPRDSQDVTIDYKPEAFKKDFDGEIANASSFLSRR